MKTLLFYLKRTVWVVVLLATITSNGQQTKTPGLKSQPNKVLTGKQAYKAAMLFDSKDGKTRETKAIRLADDAQKRAGFEFEMLKDPKTGKIPNGIREAELKFSKKIPEGNDSKQAIATASKSAKAGDFSYWKNRGPYNVGGRTRALAIDRTNENIILAGGVSGGLWRSTNGGTSWEKVTNLGQSPSITCIVQDPRPGKEKVWYYGSGERFGNSASGGGAFYQGTGVYKSTNGGLTWGLLEATKDNDVTAFSPLDIINSIVINRVNGDIYLGTFTGVYRSQDDGKSFQEVLVGGYDNKAEVAVTSTGQVYATIDSGGDPNNGYFTTKDGDTWTEITPEVLPADYGRTVMGIDPSNENIVYFFTNNQISGAPALFKYDASAIAEEAWTDLTANLPTNIGGPVGNLNLQSGYNMVIKVSPADPNLVFVGGTNLYRSTTGFTTPAGQESWIAGYSPLNYATVYPDQHPDQHALVFYPSNPNKALTGSDGGVSVTEDITTSISPEEPVDWVSLNNGYLTTQPYHVSFDPEANSDDLLAGFQDNNTWYTNSTDPKATWESIFSGDGSYCAIADGGRTRYASAQFGSIYRYNYDETGEAVSFTRVQPAGTSGFRFITPFILDANNDNIMYLPARNRIWRNNDLDEIPLTSNGLTTVNWVGLSNTDVPEGTITSLDVSKYPVANRLYYGTSVGGIYKMDNANLDSQEVVDIASGKGLPTGFVNDINVDPSNSDRVIVTFSNYGVISLFFTDDAGETWTNISGNLEENADGTGNGPSVRSTAFLGGSQESFDSKMQRVFAATSTGLYYTFQLNGEETYWIKEPDVIGNAVADEVITRKDGFIALAAHGSGVFSARFPFFNELPEATLSVAYLLDDVVVDINNIEDTEVDVTDLFVQSNGNPIDIKFTNSNPEVVTASLDGNTIKLRFTEELTIGTEATISLVATSGKEQVAEGFTVFVSEIPIYDQNGVIAGSSSPSQFFIDFNAVSQIADDFTIPGGNTWTLERVFAVGRADNSPELTNATVILYQDNAGVPGEEVYNSGEIVPVSDPNDTNLNLLLPEPVLLESGNYWISVYANLAFGPDQTQWFWSTQNEVIGQESHFRYESLFTQSIDWTPLGDVFKFTPVDQVFQIFGTVGGADTGTSGVAVAPLTTLDATKNTSIYPNPSNKEFIFNFGDAISKSNTNITISIFNTTGNLVYTKSDINMNNSFVWDASSLTSGFYYAKVSGATTGIYKLLKK